MFRAVLHLGLIVTLLVNAAGWCCCALASTPEKAADSGAVGCCCCHGDAPSRPAPQPKPPCSCKQKQPYLSRALSDPQAETGGINGLIHQAVAVLPHHLEIAPVGSSQPSPTQSWFHDSQELLRAHCILRL